MSAHSTVITPLHSESLVCTPAPCFIAGGLSFSTLSPFAHFCLLLHMGPDIKVSAAGHSDQSREPQKLLDHVWIHRGQNSSAGSSFQSELMKHRWLLSLEVQLCGLSYLSPAPLVPSPQVQQGPEN